MRVLIVTTQTWMQLTRLALRLSRRGATVSALCPPASELHFFAGIHTCQPFHQADPQRELMEAVEASGADYLVPGDDLSVWLLHELAETRTEYRPLVERSIGRRSGFATVRSRHSTLDLAQELGIAVPRTALVHSAGEAQRWGRAHGTPVVIKKDGTWGGGGVAVVHELAALGAQYERLAARNEAALPGHRGEAEISVQSYIEGVAANAMFACDQGRILGQVQARVVAARGKTGPAIMIDLIDEPRMLHAGKLLAGSLGLSGFFGLDFILEQGTGQPYLIELNPRCTQMGHIALADRADLATILWAHWAGSPVPACGPAPLPSSVCFYPNGLEGALDSGFMDRARLDVCAEDRPLVDVLAKGNPALWARSLRGARNLARAAKRSVLPSRPEPIYFFSDQPAERIAAPSKVGISSVASATG